MFWILRRTGAVNFFNSINNNYSSKSNANNNNNTDRNNPRPPRKEYGRLSVEDDTVQKQKTRLGISNNDNEFDSIDNFNILDTTTKNITDFGQEDLCDGESDSEMDRTSKDNRNPRYNETTINRLQAMAISDDDEYDESLTCNVCDRAFHCHRQLASHQQKKRHFGCSGCDSLFPSLMLLEHHKEEFEHWSDVDDDNGQPACCRRNRGDDYTDTDSITSDAESEDLERLL